MTAVQTRLGWIGAGRMGHAMVTRLLNAGYDVHVWNRTRAKAADLTDIGATVVNSLGDLAHREIIFTMVAADADLLEVLLGAGGLLKQETAPRIIVDSSTVSAETSRQVRQAASTRGCTLLVAPVSGNAKVARAGRLSIAVSGPRRAFDEVAPLLDVIGESATYVGDGDLARLVKIAHNVLLGIVTQALAEVTVLAERGGVSRAEFLQFLNGSVLGSSFSRYKSPAFVNLDLTPTFTTKLLAKDLDLGLAAGRQLQVPLPMAAATEAIVQAAIGRGHGDFDFASLLVEQARSAGLALEPENVPIDDGLGTPSVKAAVS